MFSFRLFVIFGLAALSAHVAAEDGASPKPITDEEIAEQGGKRASDYQCGDALTTNEIEVCLGRYRDWAQKRQMRYLNAALELVRDFPKVVEQIKASDAQFHVHREIECDAMYEYWIEGTIRGTQAQICHIELIDSRTLAIWNTWLRLPCEEIWEFPRPLPTISFDLS